MSEGRVLTPANENPWYVLMTLYGEQEGEGVDRAFQDQNRAVWNAWSCQAMTKEKRAEVASFCDVTVEELSAWPEMRENVYALHRAIMVDRNEAQFRYPGFPEFESPIKLSDTEFLSPTYLDRRVFAKNIIFNRSIFRHAASFDSAVFCGSVSFGFSKFGGPTFFEKSTFQLNTNFQSAVFYRSSGFDRTNFIGEANFEDSEFYGDASFSGAKFSADVGFSGSIFRGGADFHAVVFQYDAHFSYAKMTGDSNFWGVEFGSFVNFNRAEFGLSVGEPFVSFKDCQFSKPVSFYEASFRSQYPDFSGTVLHDKTTFTAKPEFWPQGPQSDPEQAKASCAVIRHNLGKQGLPEEEHFFFRREMGFAAQIGGWWQRLPYRAFGLVSDFGFSIQRPALWMLGLFVCVAMINHAVLQWGATLRGEAYHPVQAFALSFANQFPLFGLHGRWFSMDYLRDLNPWLKALGGLQTVASLPLLFFLGLGLRTRFRMR